LSNSHRQPWNINIQLSVRGSRFSFPSQTWVTMAGSTPWGLYQSRIDALFSLNDTLFYVLSRLVRHHRLKRCCGPSPMDNAALRNVSSFPPPTLRPFPGGPRPLPVKPAAHEPDANEVFTTIRRQIESGQQTPGAVLNALVVVAQALTGANGAAIAMRQQGHAVCVARSGETAPEVGDPVGTGAGISGACLQSGKILLCDDTQLDPRVDAQLCRHLGLRSIAAAPIHDAGRVVGILELFSVFAYAFSQEHMSFLQSMAELAEAARARERAETLSEAAPPAEPPWPLAGVAPAYPLEEALRRLPNLLPVQEKRPYWVWGAALFAIVVLLTSVWEIWHVPRSQSAGRAAAANTQSSSPALALAAAPGSKSAAYRQPKMQERKRAERRRHEHEEEAADVVRQTAPAEAEIPPIAVANGRVGQLTPSGQRVASAAAPQISALGTGTAALKSVLAAAPGAPRLGAPVSLGASPPVLDHQVAPAYPVLARKMKVEGPVVLDIVIDEDGSVSVTSIVSGHPMLTRAAMAAVKQWHYQPALLNGKPVKVESRVTVNFKLE
jgi:TonB family protein